MMKYPPSGVGACLYSGVMNKIEFVKQTIVWDSENRKKTKEYLESYMKDIGEAIEFYNEYCILSGKYLNEAFEELKIEYETYKSNFQSTE